MRRHGLASGFTLIELMMVTAIIGLLASIAIPKFAGLIIRSKEAALEGHLGSLRSAVSIYYADNEGYLPTDDYNLFQSLTTGKRYMNEIVEIAIPTQPSHVRNNYSGPIGIPDWGWPLQPIAWTYSATTGQFGIACTHADSKGRVWSTK